MDEDWRALEREWRKAPEERAALERAIGAMERAGVFVPSDMLAARVYPGRSVTLPFAMDVWAIVPGRSGPERVELAVESRGLLGALRGADRVVNVPEAHVWGVGPGGRRLRDTLEFLRREEIPGIRLPSHRRLTTEEEDALGELTLLRYLELSGGRVSSSTLEQIGKLQQLLDLNLERTRGVTDVSLRQLAALRRLSSLFLGGCGEWRPELYDHSGGDPEDTEGDRLDRLDDDDDEANLWNRHNVAALTDACIEHFVALPDLSWLDIAGSHVTANGVRRLVAGCKKLTLLDLADCPRITELERESLTRELNRPGFELRWERR